MSIFDSYIVESEIALEDYIDLLEASLMNPDDDEVEDNAIQEGVNMDMAKTFSSMRKELRGMNKKAKAALKAKNFSEAKSEINKMIKVVESAEKEIDNFDAGSAKGIIFGAFGGFIMSCVEYSFPLCLAIDKYLNTGGVDVGKAGISVAKNVATTAAVSKVTNDAINVAFGMATPEEMINNAQKYSIPLKILNTAHALIIVYKDIKQFMEECKSSDKDDKSKFNYYKIKLKKYLNEYKKALDKALQNIDKLIAKSK